MDYIEDLWETIKSEGRVHENAHICLGLDQIAKSWNQMLLLNENRVSDEFLERVFLVLKNLEDRNFIKFKSAIPKDNRSKKPKSLEEIVHLKSLDDKICLEIKDSLIETISGSPKFEENPPQIIWGNIKISIPFSSIQHSVCRILFSRKLGEIVSWDEIMNEVAGGDDFSKNDWRIVYDAVSAVNKKIKAKTGKNIFKTARKSFCRII